MYCSAAAVFWYVLTMASNSSSIHYRQSFFENNPVAWALIELFDSLPGVIFYAKDTDSCYTAANQAMLDAKNLKHANELLGRTDRDFHPAVLADAYIAEDRRVIEQGLAQNERIWFIIDRHGRPGWFSQSKIPLKNLEGEVIGVAAVRYAIETPEDRMRQFKTLAPVIRFFEKHHAESISMKKMAQLAEMSATHFNRSFMEIFAMSPTRFLHCLRIERARLLLAHSDQGIGEIAIDTGYHDQSHFTRHFSKLTGVTPRVYRLRFRQG